MKENPFDSPAMGARIIAQVARVQSKLMGWVADPSTGALDTKIVEVLTDSLDAHAQAYLTVVDRRDLVAKYLAVLRDVGNQLIRNAEERGPLSDPYSEARLRKKAQSSAYIRKKASLTEEQQDQELRNRVELIRDEQMNKALKWQEWKNEILTRIEMQFEARYSHWKAEAIEQAEQKIANPDNSQKLRTRLKVTKWEDIEISFLSEHRVQIRSGPQIETCNYTEFGLADRRTGKPKRAWEILQTLAGSEGSMKDAGKTAGRWPVVEKRMQELRKLFRDYFGILDDPLPFIEGAGYRARFKIVRARSYNA